jgi:hypothetical protein
MNRRYFWNVGSPSVVKAGEVHMLEIDVDSFTGRTPLTLHIKFQTRDELLALKEAIDKCLTAQQSGKRN